MILNLDISTNAKTKEEYLSKGCQARIRGYLAKARSQLFSAKFDDIVLDGKNKPFPKYLNEDGSDNDIKKSDDKRQETAIHRNKRKPRNLETLDEFEEDWDEIDAKKLNEYRGIHIKIICFIVALDDSLIHLKMLTDNITSIYFRAYL